VSVIAEPTRAERWLYLQLSSDPTIAGIVGTRIYANVAPQTVTTYPMVVFQMLGSAEDVRGSGPSIIWSKLTYLVKAITSGNSATSLQTLVDRIMTVLHTSKGGTADAAIDYCVRKRPFRMATVENNTQYQHLGGEFEIAVRAASVSR
jgi:hypothetical protein